MPTLPHPLGDLEYVLLDGDPDLPTLVFLHEGLGSAGQWGRLPSLVSDATGMRALVYSRHGYGGSAGDGPQGADYLHREGTDVLPEVLDALGIDTPFLVGHSDGASIAVVTAGTHQVRAAVLIAPHLVVEDTTLTGIRDTAARFDEQVRPSLAMFHDDPDGLFARWSGVWLSEEFASFDLTDLLPRIDVPLLVAQGVDDEYGTSIHLDAVAEHASGPVQTRLLAGHGHHPHLKDPEAIARLIADFAHASLSMGSTKEAL
ncbi:alpha/beta hydrolase [Gordonia sp. HY285]|uniref:alpha/beta fold hydrolase n=1 Tax=Gordonia liuliyuniae TaxID=2911517 RepID=UPI001F2A78A0|nr:alpha/beta hydrolase [Gordonia liuliyuniae]MCF8609764.1 alpha/beta hydrolase [Gordonia liuliyuniae]